MLQKLIIWVFLSFSQSSSAQYKQLKEILPVDFTILDSASGDINKDGIKDIVLILKNNYEPFNTGTARPLLLLQGNKEGNFIVMSRNDSVVLCMGCGGAYGDPYDGITIKNGYFSIEHHGGSGWRWTRIITFKFDKKNKSFLLHRDAGYSWHISDPNKTTENIFNKTDFDKLSFEKYSFNKNR